MHAYAKGQPRNRPQVFSFQGSRDSEQAGKGRQVPWIQILVHDVEVGPGDGQGQQRRHECNPSPSRRETRETLATELPASQEKEKNRGQMPQKNPCFKGQACNSQRERNEIGEQCQVGMRAEELAPHGKQCRVKNLLDTRQVDLRILGEGMVSMHKQSTRGEREQPYKRLVSVRSDSIHSFLLLCSSRYASLFEIPRSFATF